jgi:thiol-disulfide isomerase/thioredoxin/tetratricopeptide (TPR) repeat protein
MAQPPRDHAGHTPHDESIHSSPTPPLSDPAVAVAAPAGLPTIGFAGHTAEDPSPADQRVIGDYELVEEIARGGMGVVFKARHVSLHRLVALKMILGGPMASAQDVLRFRAEAEDAANLDHPNIVPIYEVGEHAGLNYFTMKFMEGGTLADQVARFAQDPQAAARLLVTVASAVHHAHQHGILHRDLKPGNILLDAAGQPHVTDFGLAKNLEGASALTQPGAIVGTPSYMAPEQATGTKTLTTAADIYSLGAILFELLTGRPPFQAATPLDTALAVLEHDPPRPRQLNPRVPRDLETICLKCLEKEPARRYGSADALARDLERWLAGEPIRARPSSAGERVVKWARRRPAGAALVLVTLLAVAGTVVVGVLYHFRLREVLARVEVERQRAEENAARAQREQAEAAANFQKARDAVDNMLTRVAEGRLANLSRMQSVRLELLREALKFYQGFLQDKSDDPTILQETGWAYRRVGDVSLLARRQQEAEAAYRQALVIQRRLASQFPARSNYRSDLAATGVHLAALLARIGRRDEAAELYREAVALREKLTDEFPAEPEYRRRWASSLHALTRLLAGPEAEKSYRQALAVQQKLVADFPQVAAYASEAATTAHSLGEWLLGQNRSGEARQHFEAAHRWQRKAIQLDPAQPNHWTLWRVHYRQLARVLELQGDHAGLARLSAEVLQTSPENPSDAYNAACYLGRAVTQVRKDGQLSEADREKRSRDYADQALALLAEAVQKGYRKPADAARDRDLEPLREREEYKRLLVEMKKRPTGERSEVVAREYQSILAEYQAAEQVLLKALSETRPPEQQKEVLRKAPDPEAYARRFLDLAEANPRDVVSVDALNWILENLGTPEASPITSRAVEQLTRFHAQSGKVGRSCLLLSSSTSPVTEGLLRAVLEQNPYRQQRAAACLALARYVKKKIEDAEKRKESAAALLEEADQLYEQLQTRYGDIKIGTRTLAEAARAELNELRNLRIGKVAPEIEGEDLDGKPMKLSDYRGKVVVLDFWAHWCGHCRALYAQERELVKRHAGQPFVLLGVNGDTDRAETRNVVAREQLNWRSWWAGGETGRRLEQPWSVQTIPMIYVLDARGMIRYKGLRGKELDAAVAHLLRELKLETGKSEN